MERKVVSLKGEALRSIELSDAVFGLPINEDVIYYAINNELANLRVGTACTKTRAEVHGTNRRPYSQKGTGRARQGDRKSPLFVGGGVVFGPRPRDYSQKGTGRARQGDRKSPLFVGGGVVFGPRPRDYSYAMPKKAKRLAMKSILSLKAQNETLTVLEDFTVESGKTGDLVKKLEALVDKKAPARTVVVLASDDEMVKRAGRNLPWLSFLKYDRLRAHDLFYGRKVFVLESAAKGLNEFYADK